MRKRYLLLMIALMPLIVVAQDITATLPVPAQKSGSLFRMASDSAKGKPVLLQPFYWVKTLIDSSAVATVDRSYIEQPKLPWSVELRTEFSQSSQKTTSGWSYEGVQYGTVTTRTDNGFSTSVGLWVGYRGYGFGLSKELTRGDGSSLSFGAMGGSFGINLRINSYRSRQPLLESEDFISPEESASATGDLDDPIHVRSLFIDGYYMLNGKHFSYAAAYDQSLIQRKSAGSVALGLMYYHSRVSYEQDSNWPVLFLMNGVGKLKFTQANVGVGYAYNWVPARGWLVSAQVMPMVAFFNQVHTYYYDIVDKDGYSALPKIREQMEDPDWNGEIVEDEGGWRVVDYADEKTNGSVRLNFDGRMSVSYNWSRWYLRVYGHYNRFTYKNGDDNGRWTDWKAYASLGFRF
ncbi:MAG: DUF4421 family protein [Prevotella sp.]|nr:DUF4421 family protein [Prevotella sp.]